MSAVVLISAKSFSKRTQSFTWFCTMTTYCMALENLKSENLSCSPVCLELSLMDIDLVLGTYSKFLSTAPALSC